MHDHHETLPGYSPAQIFHDHCGECETRGARPAAAFRYMDREIFRRAVERAYARVSTGLPDVAYAEIPVLDTVWAMLELMPRPVRGLYLAAFRD